MPDDVSVGIDLTLANGKGYSRDNLDLTVLMNINNIHRGYKLTGVRPQDNFNVMEHTFGSQIIGARYFMWLDNKGKNEILDALPKSIMDKWGNQAKYFARTIFLDKILEHDLDEVVLDDRVPSMKDDYFRDLERKVGGDIGDYLGTYKLSENSEELLHKHLKVVDLIQSLWEIKTLVERRNQPQVARIYGERLKILAKFVDLDEIKPFVEEIGAYSDNLWKLPNNEL
jgi:hypothetical protein